MHPSPQHPVLWSSVLFLLAFLAIWVLIQNPNQLSQPEAGMLSVIFDVEPAEGSLREQARFVAQSIGRSLGDVESEPSASPLYNVLLDVWAILLGQSIPILRIFSGLWGVIAFAGLMRLSTHLGLPRLPISFLILITVPFLYLAVDISPWMMVFALSICATLVGLQYRRYTQRYQVVLYAVFILCLAVTHYVAMVLLAMHIVLFYRHRPLLTVNLLGIMVLFAWVVSRTPLVNISSLLLPLLVLVCFVGLAVAWRLWTNRGWRKFYLPIGYLLLQVGLFFLLPSKPGWGNAVERIAESRTPLQPLVIQVPPNHPVSYYVRNQGQQGILLDIGWREFAADEQQDLVDALGEQTTLWMIAYADAPLEPWLQNKQVQWVDQLDDVVFYRLERDG